MIYINLLKGIDEKWTVVEKVRYLYVQLGKNISYDERFAYGKDPKIMEEIYYKDISMSFCLHTGLWLVHCMKQN